jgi:hypothetical protein
MSPLGFIFAVIIPGLAYIVPQRWGLVPLLIGATWVPRSQELELGPLHFGVARLAVLAGLLRMVVKREQIVGSLHVLDRLMIAWGIWYVGSSAFHTDNSTITRIGEIYTDLGIYFLCRVFLRDHTDIVRLFKVVCWLLLPVAVLMLAERMTGNNPFSMFFGNWLWGTEYRNGHYRAHGPFAIAISAGTVGAICLPMALYLGRQDRKVALLGMFGAGGVVYASGASGPVMTAFSVLVALALWKIRDQLRAIRWLVVFVLIALDLVMSDPVYFLLGRIDITGGSTGYYRAALIQAAIKHFNEWWLIGTDYTKHWLLGGGGVASPNHTDLTNHYIAMGVMGGMPLMLLFMGVIYAAFNLIGRVLKLDRASGGGDPYLAWILGSILFGHATTFLSVSYFDVANSVYFYLLLGTIGAVYAAALVETSPRFDNEHSKHDDLEHDTNAFTTGY